jgi:subtilisin family serine protease
MLMPWAHRWGVFSTPGSLLVKLALGEAPESIPAWVDVRTGASRSLAHLDRGPVDRVLRHFTDGLAVSRVHASARGLGRPGAGHLDFDETEHAIGLSRTFQVDVDDDCDLADLLDALRHLEIVEEAYPHYLCSVPFTTAEAGRLQLQAEEAWEVRDLVRAAEAMAYEPGDAAVILSVVDTGVTLQHPELRDRLRRGRDTVLLIPGDLPSGARLLDEPGGDYGDPGDAVGHGTSCAAIMSAAGEAMPPGLAGACSCLPIRVLGAALFPGRSAPVGIGAIADIDCGVKTAIDLGAKVLNLSFGTPQSELLPDDPPPHADVVRYGLARGCILVAASGNSGRAEAYSPACLDGVIAVGAADRQERPASFSTSGPHVAIAAPGVQVVSAGLHGYARVTGTSFAAPFVAATAALLVARAERRAYPLDGPTVRRLVCASARPWPADVAAEGRGSGLLDAYAALLALDREIDQTPDHATAHRRRAGDRGGEPDERSS